MGNVNARCGVCPGCPASRREVFDELLGEGRGDCRFTTLAIEPRAHVPVDWAERGDVVLVRRGILVRGRWDPDGQVAAIDAVGAGGLAPLRAGHTAYAAGPAAVCILSRDRLDGALAGGNGTARDLLRLQSEALARVEAFAALRGRNDVTRRVGAALLLLAQELGRGEPVVPSDLQQRDLARLVGARHESVCRSLRELEVSAFVRKDAGGLRILDRGGLEQLAA